ATSLETLDPDELAVNEPLALASRRPTNPVEPGLQSTGARSDDSSDLAVASAVFPAIDWPMLAVGTWLSGMLAAVGVWVTGYFLVVWRLPAGEPCESAWRAQWYELLAAHGVRQPIQLRVTRRLGPMLCRLPRGYALLVPATLWRDLDVDEREAILRHELAHYL